MLNFFSSCVRRNFTGILK